MTEKTKTKPIELFFIVALFLGVLGLYAISWRYSLSNGAHFLVGGKSTVGAERVIAGEIPYRDFWTMYAPGQFYLLALLFSVFGSHLMVEVVAASIVCAATVCVCYRLGYNLTGRRFASFVPGIIYFAAMYNTGYVKNLGSYPTAAFLVFLSLNLSVLFWKSGGYRYLIASGLVTGLTAIFKHDVAGYTAIAILTGQVTYFFLGIDQSDNKVKSLLIKLVIYAVSIAVVFLPIFLYFTLKAGPDMLQDLIIFPLTDFPFARPEAYPSLLPINIVDESMTQTIRHIVNYLIFTNVFVLFILGFFAIVLAAIRRKPLYVAAGITFTTGFLLHYIAAHTQINTHIITMSVYVSLIGLMLYDMLEGKILFQWPILQKSLLAVFVIVWLLALLAQPGYVWLKNRSSATVKLNLPKVAGFMVSPEEAQALMDLTEFVDANIPPDQELYVGLDRHDAVIIGDVMIYFILDRKIATRYHELHPAITDTQQTQQEIIKDLQWKGVEFVILRQMFPDFIMDDAKANLKQNLPYVGATDLDNFIMSNYVKVQQYGPYSIWKYKVAS